MPLSPPHREGSSADAVFGLAAQIALSLVYVPIALGCLFAGPLGMAFVDEAEARAQVRIFGTIGLVVSLALLWLSIIAGTQAKRSRQSGFIGLFVAAFPILLFGFLEGLPWALVGGFVLVAYAFGRLTGWGSELDSSPGRLDQH